MGPVGKAILRISRVFLETLMPDWKACVQVRYGNMVESRLPADVKDLVSPYHAVLRLPPDCCIVGISIDYAFDRDEVAFRVESVDFVETIEGNTLPEVFATYQTKYGSIEAFRGRGFFLCWMGPGVAVKRFYGPDGREVASTVIAGRQISPDVTFVVGRCWQCNCYTEKKLSDGTPECNECSGKSLL